MTSTSKSFMLFYAKYTEKLPSFFLSLTSSKGRTRWLSAWLCIAITEANYRLSSTQVSQWYAVAPKSFKRALTVLIDKHPNHRLRINARKLLSDLASDRSNPN